MTATTDGLCARNRSPHHHKTITQDVEEPTKSRKIHSKSGFSRLRIACWLRLRTASNKGIVLLLVISLLVMIRLWTFTSGGNTTTSSSTVVLEKKKPRLLQLMDNHTHVVANDDLQLPSTRRYNEYWINHGSHWFKPRSRVKEGCIPLQDWYDDQHPLCNLFHEIPLRRLYDRNGGFELARLVNNGAYRDVWGIRDFDGDRRVLKTLKYEREFDERNFDRHRRDGMAVEQLSASPHVVDIYGYCANSALYDYSDGGDLFDVFDDDKPPSKNELLKIAHDVAQSIADSHRYNKDGIATMAHTDIKPNQFLNMNGTYQLNDFNRCRFLTWNPETQEHCGFTVKKNGGVWRAPEEYRYEPETEKIDVYSLGHVLYFLLTNGKVPFEDMRTSDANAYVAEGKRIHVHDESILGSTHLFDTTLLKALDMCYVEDPKRRPSAQKVANLLKRALDRIKQDDS